MIRVGLVMFALIMPQAGMAQSMTPADCTAAWAMADVLGAVTHKSAAQIDADGWCVAEDVTFDMDRTVTIMVDRVALKVDGIDRVLRAEPLPPYAVALRITGLRTSPQIGDPLMDYLFKAQADAFGINGDIAAHWDAQNMTFTLDRFAFDFPGDNALSMTGLIAGVDLTDLNTMQFSVGRAALSSLSLEVQTNGLFETYLLMPLGPTLLDPEADPQAQVNTLIAQAKGVLAQLPSDMLPKPSHDAIVSLLDEMPNPAGTLTLDIVIEGGLGAGRLMGAALSGVPDTAATFLPLLDGLTMNASWTPHVDDPK